MMPRKISCWFTMTQTMIIVQCGLSLTCPLPMHCKALQRFTSFMMKRKSNWLTSRVFRPVFGSVSGNLTLMRTFMPFGDVQEEEKTGKFGENYQRGIFPNFPCFLLLWHHPLPRKCVRPPLSVAPLVWDSTNKLSTNTHYSVFDNT